MPYIIHTAILLSACYLLYQFFLKSETFFGLNRWILMICIISAFIIPTLEIPESWSLRKVNQTQQQREKSIPNLSIIADNSMENTVENDNIQTSTKKTEALPLTENETKKTTTIPIITEKKTNESMFKRVNWKLTLQYIYGIGLAIFGLNFLIQFLSLILMIIKNPSIKDGDFRIIEMSADKAPYSFMNNIFINPTKYDWETYTQILEHEKIHVKERHTLDILFAEFVIIFQWFNPFAWQIRKVIERNLEFLTDSKMLQNGTDRATYQLNLLKISAPDYPLNITTNYNQSFLKTRIMMMEAKKSSMRSAWKYLLLLPIFGVSIITLNAVKPDLKKSEKQAITRVTDEIENHDDFGIPTVGEFEAKKNGNLVCVDFLADVSEEEGENMTWSYKKCFKQMSFLSLPTEESTFEITRDAGTLVFTGSFEEKIGTGTYEFKLSEQFRDAIVQFGEETDVTPDKLFLYFLNNTNLEYINYVKAQNYEDFSLEEMAGLSIFGVSFKEFKALNTDLKDIGYNELRLEEIQELNIHNVSTDYIKTMNSKLNRQLDIPEIVNAKIHNVNATYIKELEAAGFKDLDFETVTAFSIHNISMEYVKSLENTGLDLETEQIVAAAIHNVQPEYIKQFQDIGLENFDFEDVIGFATHNIKIEYIQSLQAAGLGDLDGDDFIAAAIHNVNPQLIKKYQAANLKDLDFEDIVAFAAHNIEVEYIQSLQAANLGDIDNDDLVGAAIHRVDPQLIKKYQALNLEDLDFDDILGFAIHNVDVAYIKSLQNAGLGNLEADEVVEAAIHNVNPETIKKYQSANLKGLDFEDIIQFSIHNVELDYIESLRNAGIKNLEAEDIIQAAIHNVSASTIKKFQNSDLDNLDFEDIIQFSMHNVDLAYIKAIKNSTLEIDSEDIVGAKIHGVTLDFIKEIQQLNFENLTLNEVLQAKIHDVDANYIKERRKEGFEGEELSDFIDLKIGME